MFETVFLFFDPVLSNGNPLRLSETPARVQNFLKHRAEFIETVDKMLRLVIFQL